MNTMFNDFQNIEGDEGAARKEYSKRLSSCIEVGKGE
jgi:hypothetical protein